jgi:hypothetical protein
MIIDEMFNMGEMFAWQTTAGTYGDAICDARRVSRTMKHDVLVEVTSTNTGLEEAKFAIPITFIERKIKLFETASLVPTNLFAVEECCDGT